MSNERVWIGYSRINSNPGVNAVVVAADAEDDYAVEVVDADADVVVDVDG